MNIGAYEIHSIETGRFALDGGAMFGIVPSMLSLACLVCLLWFFSAGCRDNPVAVDDKQAALYAKVTESNGNVIADVGFHYIFYDGLNFVWRNATIQYALPTSDTVTLKIYDSFGQEVATLLNRVFEPAGVHSYVYDATGITNGVYEYRLTTSSSTSNGKFFIRSDDPLQLKSTPPFAKFDQSGNLQISYRALGIGTRFTYQAGNNPIDLIIRDSITVLLVKQGYRDLLQTIRVDTTKATEATFKMVAP